MCEGDHRAETALDSGNFRCGSSEDCNDDQGSNVSPDECWCYASDYHGSQCINTEECPVWGTTDDYSIPYWCREVCWGEAA